MGLSSSYFGLIINLTNSKDGDNDHDDDDNNTDSYMCLMCCLLPLCLYVLWDVNHALRMVCTVIWAQLFGGGAGSRRQRCITDRTSIRSWCTVQDVGIAMQYMNQARYVRELDFARAHFYAVTGLYDGVVLQGAEPDALSIRYRRSIPVFRAYRIETRLVWWDDGAMYLEQRFVTRADGFVRAVAMSRQCVAGGGVLELLAGFAGGERRPEGEGEPPAELRTWLASIELSDGERVWKE